MLAGFGSRDIMLHIANIFIVCFFLREELLLFQIPPGTQSHQQMRLVGKGIPRLNGIGRGDHYINFKVHLPK